MTTLLLAVSLSVLGVLVGIYVTGIIHDYRVADLSGSEYAAIHQMRDKTFRQVMPVLGLTSFNMVLLAVIAAVAPGAARMLGIAAALMLLADIVLTITMQLPLNRQIQAWAEAGIPANWSDARDRWGAHHNIRATLAALAYLLFTGAVFLSV